MTALQHLYAQERLKASSHQAAILAVARVTGLDVGTVQRNLKRAERAS